VNENSSKIESVISEKRVKLHYFVPSNRKIWTIVGKEKEHWLDPDLRFCSCTGFYFGMLKNKKPCYHIESVKIAKKQEQYERIDFSDDEFESFMSGLIKDL
jgi:predicted nucleic acid-binding Zn finger protein|tara:strand:- start:308 stop:610 length:303 start_codon:yes stop_codon:yes gene_type:complete